MRTSDPCYMGQHDRCKSPFCRCDQCACEATKTRVVEGETGCARGTIGAQEKTAPGGALTPESQGLADYRGVD